MTESVPMLRRLLLKRFRSVPAADIEFGNLAFMVGRNGSGKSNIVDAFEFLSEAMAMPLQTVFDWRGGTSAVSNRTSARSRPPDLGIGVVLSGLNGKSISARYAFELRFTKDYAFEVLREQCIIDRPDDGRDWFERRKFDQKCDQKYDFRSNVAMATPALESGALALPLVGGETRFQPVHRFLSEMKAYNIEPSALREMQDPYGGAYLHSDGGNAASMLREIKRKSKETNWQMILDFLKAIVPGTINVGAKKHGNKLALEFSQDWKKTEPVKFEGYNMSDGTLRAVGILTAAFQQPSPSVLIIEEPESTIHPGALGAILDVLEHASQFMQVIITTHSPDILDAKWIKSDHLKIVSWDQGTTYVDPISEEAKGIIEDHLEGAGDLLRAGSLTADVSERSLFVSKPEQLPLFADDLG